MNRATALRALLLGWVCLTPASADFIEDNSFLIEEAYNQQPGVVQHINTFQRDTVNRAWQYSFTQEWPIPDQANQFSYTIPALQTLTRDVGFGDTLLNYRRQVVGFYPTDPEHRDKPAYDTYRVALAPRLSMVVPTGDWRRGNGRGSLGLQANVPLSVAITRTLIWHLNAGSTWLPSAKDGSESHSALDTNYGTSFVYHLASTWDALFEMVGGWNATFADDHSIRRLPYLYLNPGLRFAINFKNGLQIVPGLAYTIGVGPSDGLHMAFAYLSFEHPYTKAAQH